MIDCERNEKHMKKSSAEFQTPQLDFHNDFGLRDSGIYTYFQMILPNLLWIYTENFRHKAIDLTVFPKING